MMIQTLVENGIKHGISKLTKGGVIEIKTEVHRSSLHIYIYNSGTYSESIKKGKNETGFGLENTRKRLELLYGAAAHFSIENIGSDTVLTEIRIPEQVLMAKSLVES
jgi:LytS/YehU family sensor histidine kinase